jgi:AcrR family transcriptional regulator
MSPTGWYPSPVSATPLSREARKAQTRDAIVAAATKLFTKQGIEATSLDRIAADVGLTKGAVYSTFANKDELVEAVAIAASVVIGPEILFEPDVSLRDGVADLARQLITVRRRMTSNLVMLEIELFLYERRHRSWGKRVLAEQKAAVAEAATKLEAAVTARGETLPLPAVEFLNALQAMARGVVQELERDPDSISPDAVVTLFTSLVD